MLTIEEMLVAAEESKQILKADGETLKITDTQTGINLTLDRLNFENETEEKKFIKSVERLIRSSIEYREWLSFLKDSLQMNICVFTGETDEETNDIEIHHHPLTLYDIVQAVIDSKIMKDMPFNSFDIAREVIDLHFKLKVGFVPLLRSLHKKFHNGFLQIPIELVHGDYKYILDNYYIREEVLEKVSKYESVKLENFQKLSNWSKDNYAFMNVSD